MATVIPLILKKQDSSVTIRDGLVIRIDPSFSSLTGYPWEMIVGRPFEDVLSKDLRATLAKTDIYNTVERPEFFIFTRAMEPRQVRTKTVKTPVAGEYEIIFRKTFTKLYISYNCAKSMLRHENIALACYAVTPRVILLGSNKAYLDLLNISRRDEAIGRDIQQIFPDWKESNARVMWETLLAKGKFTHLSGYEHRVPGQSPRFLHSTLFPIFERGGLKYVVEATSDITKGVVDSMRIEELRDMTTDEHHIELNTADGIRYLGICGTPVTDGIDAPATDISYIRDAAGQTRREQDLKENYENLIREERAEKEALAKEIETNNEFISFITHEFKTPLAVINSAVQAIEYLCKDELTDQFKGFLRKIKQNSFRQLRLVNNLLDITRINAGHYKVILRNLDIVFLAREITESVRLYAQQKNIRLEFLPSMKTRIVGIDEEKFERIMLTCFQMPSSSPLPTIASGWSSRKRQPLRESKFPFRSGMKGWGYLKRSSS